MGSRCRACTIVPPYILHRIAESGDPVLRARARDALALTEQLRGRRSVLDQSVGTVPAGVKRRSVYDAKHGTRLPGTLVRGEDGPSSADNTVEEAFGGAGDTYDFYRTIFGRSSIDDRGARLDSSVHYGVEFNNAFWDGRQMVYGDGDGEIFLRFTACLDVIAHELTHGVTGVEANLEYHDQSGALNESMSDVFGALVKQWHLGQDVREADWLIGAGLLGPSIHGVALRSMKAPGTAYDDPVLGKDPQPSVMKDFVKTSRDGGGVHINSGIPNHAFYLAAVAIGGRAWEKAGAIWYDALTTHLRPTSDFQAAADATRTAAAVRFGVKSAEEQAVREAWAAVGITANAAALT